MKKKNKFPQKCEHCNTELECCEEDTPYKKDAQIIEARKCPECERVYFMGYTSYNNWVPK